VTTTHDADAFYAAARARAQQLRPEHASALLGDQVLTEVEELVDMAEWARNYLADEAGRAAAG
jgi:hypothetical protein